MGKPPADEIQILRYFETEPLEKAAILFKTVSEKMRERLDGKRDGAPKSAVAKETAAPKKSHPPPERETPPEAAPVKPGGWRGVSEGTKRKDGRPLCL